MNKLPFSGFAWTVYMPILALMLLVGCSNRATVSSDASSSDADKPGFSMEGEEQGDEEARHEEMIARLDDLVETVVRPLHGLERQYTDGMISADELYTATRVILEKTAEDEAVTSEAKQLISHDSHKLLDYLLEDDNASPEAVGYYTDMLISVKSPNADMIFEALQVLDGYWTEEHIRTTADEAIRNAEEWLSHTDEGVPYAGKDRPAIITSVRHLQSIASL